MTASLYDGDRAEVVQVVSRPTRATTTAGITPSVPTSSTSAHTFDDIFKCETVTFEVEEILFSVNKRELQAAGPTSFDTMLSFAGYKAGKMQQHAIRLEGVQTSHFRAFLRVLHRNPYGLPTLSEYDDWIGVLRLATMWEFKEIRLQAITALASLLKSMPTHEMISAGRSYRVIEWVRTGYVKICQIKQIKSEELRDPLTFSLDWETIARIYEAREMIAVGKWAPFCGICRVFTGRFFNLPECPCHITPLIDEIFREEFEGLSMNNDNTTTP